MPTALDFHLLDRRYGVLRAADPARNARLVASISADGQRTPVLVVPGAAGGFVLIDGFARVAALETLGRDTVDAVVLDLGEAEALVLGHRLETARRRTALEEGWLLLALVEIHGKRPRELAAAFQKTASWVSRRLALVRALPESVQDAVRSGRICVHGAEKFLVPLARANAGHCVRLVERLGATHPTVRQLGRVYAAWRSADAATRERIVDNPLLYLTVEEALTTPADDEDLDVLADVEAIAGICGRARRHVRDGGLDRLPPARRPALDGAWIEAQLAFEAVRSLLVEGGLDARR
jgi:ParB/RepB/Spo0J family partition protein